MNAPEFKPVNPSDAGRARPGRRPWYAALATALVCSVATLGAGAAQAAPVLVVEQGLLTGAQGVIVNGVAYDVSFQDGSCQALFNGCDEASDFTFTTAADAEAASQALLDQVLLDGPLGQFDSAPTSTRGCAHNGFCNVTTLFATHPDPAVDLLNAAVASNSTLADSAIAPLWIVASESTDFSNSATITLALWTLSPVAVSEPSALALLALAGVALGGMSGRRRRRGA